MAKDKIIVKGAREHNLKNIDVEIPRDKLVVITGLSGSGKSSLAFDTIYAEGQRRYVESLSSYARQFLGQMDKPDVDYIEGLSPAISIDQKTTGRNPRSTVGTVTEIYDYMRLLFARIGHPHCPQCGKAITQQTVDQMVDVLLAYEEGTKLQILAPLVRGRKGEHVKVFEEARKAGYVRVRVDGEVYDLEEEIKLEKNKKHTIEVVVDRIKIKPGIENRLADSLEIALDLGDGLVTADVLGQKEVLFSQHFACADCGISLEEITPRMFSFNNPYGACPACDGLGHTLNIDVDLIIPDRNLSIREGAIARWGVKTQGWYYRVIEALAQHFDFSLDTPVKDLADEALNYILFGTKGEKIKVCYDHPERGRQMYHVSWEGVVNNFERP
jgi:excinuclease ABC subunit A